MFCVAGVASTFDGSQCTRPAGCWEDSVGKNQVCSSVLCVQCAAKSGASGFPVSSDTFPISQVGKVRSEDSGRHQPRSTLGAPAPPQLSANPRSRPVAAEFSPFRSCGSSRLAPEAPSKFCLYPCTGPDPSHADIDPKSGITNPLPNLNLTTSFRPSKTAVAKRILVEGPLRRRHRPPSI